MKYQELLKQATPLPWKAPQRGTPSDFHLCVHSANVLPKALEALKESLATITEEWGQCECVGGTPDCPHPGPNCTQCAMRQAIFEIENVKD